MLHQLWGQIVVEEVDKAAEGFGSSIALGWLKQQVHQRVVDVGATGVGLLQHTTDYAGSSGIAEALVAQPKFARKD